MNYLARIAAACAIALAVAACAGNFGGNLTDDNNDIASACEHSHSEYEGHRLHCLRLEKQSTRLKCTSTELVQARAVRDKAKNWCDGNPPSTPANLAFIRGLVAQQAAIGSDK